MVGKLKSKKKILIIAGSVVAVAVIILVLMLTVFKKDNSYQGLGNADGSNGEPKNNENSTNLSNEVEFKEEELKTIILTDEDIENGENVVFDAIDTNIERMKEAIERSQLLSEKIKELRSLFEDENIPLKDLKTLKIELKETDEILPITKKKDNKNETNKEDE